MVVGRWTRPWAGVGGSWREDCGVTSGKRPAPLRSTYAHVLMPCRMVKDGCQSWSSQILVKEYETLPARRGKGNGGAAESQRDADFQVML